MVDTGRRFFFSTNRQMVALITESAAPPSNSARRSQLSKINSAKNFRYSSANAYSILPQGPVVARGKQAFAERGCFRKACGKQMRAGARAFRSRGLRKSRCMWKAGAHKCLQNAGAAGKQVLAESKSFERAGPCVC